MKDREFVLVELAESPRDGVAVLQQLAAEVKAHAPSIRRVAVDADGEREIMASDRYVAHAPGIPLRAVPDVAATDITVPQQAAESLDAQWGLAAIRAVGDYAGRGVNVAILDSGIDLDHPAFAPIAGRTTVRDFTGAGAGDPCGHGTHCAGTLFGQSVGGVRIGVAPEVAHAYIGRVLDESGSGNSSALFEGMHWAITRAHVLSMSLGFDFPGLVERWVNGVGLPLKLAAGRALQDFLANLRVFDTLIGLSRALAPTTQGCVVVAAAGNSSTPAYRLPLEPPANADGVISVGAVQLGGDGIHVATFSNTGPTLCGPGVEISSAVAGGLDRKSGTSMATPHVAGVAAQWFEALREQGEISIASTVIERMNGAANRSCFAPGTRVIDRGRGLVQAP